jgi:UDP-N-acetyl-D-glucosamine dehydrogenase
VVAAAERMRSVTLSDEELAGADCVVIVTDHTGVDYGKVTRLAPLIVDTRNALAGNKGHTDTTARIIKL